MLTNDPKHPSTQLTVTGTVENFASINPRAARLTGNVGDEIRTEVSVIPEKKYAFKVTGAKARSGKFITVKLRDVVFADGVGYVVTVTNTRTEKGRYFDAVILTTDSEIQPELTLSVFGNITEPGGEKDPHS